MNYPSFISIAKKYKAIFFDSYGVVKKYNGLIPNVQSVMDELRNDGKIIRLLTNDASRSPQRQSERFFNQGLKGLIPEEIITSGMMASIFLQQKIKQGKVAYLGTEKSAYYISNVGLIPVPMSEVNEDNYQEISAMVFLDDEGFDWARDINKTINLLRKKNIPVIIANTDKIYPVAKKNVNIATGGIAKLVENILGRKFIHFGKPDTQMFNYAFNDINKEQVIKMDEILMVGDTLKTDILGGNKFGISTVLVLSGNTRIENVHTKIKSSGIIPNYICDSITS
ncbi:MAG: HAD-IIA family hydrolase [Saprospiraceae bacterium]